MATEELTYTAHKYLELCIHVLENMVNNPMFWGAFLGAWLVASSRKNKNIFKKNGELCTQRKCGLLILAGGITLLARHTARRVRFYMCIGGNPPQPKTD